MLRLFLPTTCWNWQGFGICSRVANTLQAMYGFSFFSTSPYFCSYLWFSIPFFKGLHIYLCDQCLGLFPVINKVGLILYKLEHHRECNLLFYCNYDMLSKASIDQNELQLITSFMLWWTLGLFAVVHFFNDWHILLYMTFLGECYWNKRMLMIIYLYFLIRFLYQFFPNKVYVEFWSRHLWINFEMNNRNVMSIV